MSTTSAAQRETGTGDQFAPASAPLFELTPPDAAPQHPDLKQQVASRLAAHRARRAQTTEAAPLSGRPATASRTSRVRSAQIAAAVAERYAHSPSYRSVLAAEAERAVHQAQAVAKIATINAQAIAVAQQQLLADLDHWHPPADAFAASANVPLTAGDYAALFDREPAPAAVVATPPHPALTVRLYEDAAHPPATPRTSQLFESRRPFANTHPELDEDECFALDEEIAFRHQPVFEEKIPPEPIPANLIEFPRQLVASRKARPRLAEGPLRDDDTPAHAASQLRIFEVEADQISSAPAAQTIAPEWSSILLSALAPAEFTAPTLEAEPLFLHVPQPAPIGRRLTAAAIDAAILLTAEAAFTAVFVLALTHLSGNRSLPTVPRIPAVAAAVATFAVLAVLYQLLFFTLSDHTPGMRYARIALCTFSDENPSRSAMRRRLFSTLLAAAPLGLGLLWAFLDEDTLGWHDRISRMYQRAY